MKQPFKLEPLLKYRKSVEDQKRIELANLREKQYKEEEKLYKIREIQREIQNGLREEKGKVVGNIAYLEMLSHQSISQRKLIHELTDRAVEAQERLLEATKSRKIVEKLKKKKITEYRNFITKQENKSLDEIATNRFTRGNQNV